MGFLTTITIRNDDMGEFERDPKAFGQAILDGIEKANMDHKKISTGDIIIQPSRHADDHAVYLHSGNTVRAIGQFESNFDAVAERYPKIAMEEAQEALRIIQNTIDFSEEKSEEKEMKITVKIYDKVYRIDYDPRKQTQWDEKLNRFIWFDGCLLEVKEIHTTIEGIQFELF